MIQKSKEETFWKKQLMTNNGAKWIYLARCPLESPLTPAWVAAAAGKELFNFDESSRIIAIYYAFARKAFNVRPRRTN